MSGRKYSESTPETERTPTLHKNMEGVTGQLAMIFKSIGILPNEIDDIRALKFKKIFKKANEPLSRLPMELHKTAVELALEKAGMQDTPKPSIKPSKRSSVGGKPSQLSL